MRLTSYVSRFGLLSASVALSLPAWAQEEIVEHHAAAAGSSPVPQFNPESFSGQLFWLGISFVLLYWVMNSWALPKVGRVIEQRAAKITSDLDAANHDRDAATATIASYDKTLAKARGEAQTMIANAQAAAARAATDSLSTQSRQLSDSARLTDTRIRAAVAAAEANLLPIAADTASTVLQQLTGITPSNTAVDEAVKTALNNHRTAQAGRA